MAKIVFVQLNEYELHGLEALSAELKKRGHQTKLVIPFFEKTPLKEIADFSPDLVGFSVASVEREQALVWAKAVKRHIGVPIIFGGIDPTFFPEVINDASVDMVMRGEAEQSLSGLMDALDANEDYTGIANLWVKRDGKIYQNPVGALIEDLDTLPFPDKELYFSRYRYFQEFPIKVFLAGRGCPFACNYCANSGLRELYPNRHRYSRFKSAGYLIEELKQALARYPARTVGFSDDLFCYDQKWMEQFLPRYGKEIGIPFFCTARIDLMTDDKARLLKEANCYSVWYGLESASADDRARILNRKMSDEQIARGVEILHKYGLRVQAYSMLNYPGDSFEKALATLDFNRRVKNDFVVSALFQPFPGIKLRVQKDESNTREQNAGKAKKSGFNFFAYSPFKQKDTKKIETLHKLFILGFHSRLVFKLIPFLVKLPKNPLFDIIFLISFAWQYTKVHRLSGWETIKYNLKHTRTTYFRRRARAPRK